MEYACLMVEDQEQKRASKNLDLVLVHSPQSVVQKKFLCGERGG